MNTINVINVSGGKDSTAMLLLAIERGTPNIQAVFADTGHEHPATLEYIDYLQQATGVSIETVKANFKAQIAKKRETVAVKWARDGIPQERIDRALEMLVPTGNPFLDMVLWKGLFPSVKARFCTEELKHLPVMRQVLLPLAKTNDVLTWHGVRRDESRARLNLTEYEKGEVPNVTIYRPILDLTAADCFEMHKRHGIKWNPLYEEGMGRVGCMPCIMARQSELAEIAKRFPEEIERVAKWERLASKASRRGGTTLFDASPFIPEDEKDITAEKYGINRMVSHVTKGHGADDLFPETATMCASLYGLCE